MASRIHILLADNRSKVRFALRALLRQHPDLSIAGEASDAQALVAGVEANSPDLVLLDWELQGMATAVLIAALRTACPGLRVIVLSGRPEARQAALAAGADAFVSKIDPPDKLLAAISSRAIRSAQRGHR
jgi:two-component system response regulator DesR